MFQKPEIPGIVANPSIKVAVPFAVIPLWFYALPSSHFVIVFY
jgi:hypothetical protein